MAKTTTTTENQTVVTTTTQVVDVARSTQSAIPELGQAEKTLYYLVIGEGDKKIVINVGEKTYSKVAKLIGKPGESIDLVKEKK